MPAKSSGTGHFWRERVTSVALIPLSLWFAYAMLGLAGTNEVTMVQFLARGMTSPLDHKKWYYANDAGAAVPEGLGDEDAILAIWSDASRFPTHITKSPGRALTGSIATIASPTGSRLSLQG